MKLETMIAEAVAKRAEEEREQRERTAQAEQVRRAEAMSHFQANIKNDLGEAFLDNVEGDWGCDANTGVPHYMFYYQHHIMTLEYERQHLGARLWITAEDTRDQHAEPRRSCIDHRPQQIMLEHVLLEIHELTQDEPSF